MYNWKSCVLNHHVSFGFGYIITEYIFSATTQFLEYEKIVILLNHRSTIFM